ncbi:hypothetical protein [Actinomadura rudentiformis]|uniref:Uncharacterized protein n=1 Tax=Actinomadura rudentiformis TaxID=359158 RepID=A0A6H9YW16_9ACTN|nr:hypothetical protein [Actinomadura rudentiformis]KAB2346493.1 hypothetical protein F8566_23870 [Actinomadura rudentiformis]
MSTEPSSGERLAAALRRSPIYVDPSLADALPKAERARLLAKLRKAPAPVYVLLVPLIKGGTWTDPDQLASVVHGRLGRDGIFITLDEDSDDLAAREWGGDHQARDAAWAASLDDSLRDAPLAAKLSHTVDLIIAGTGTQEYKRLSAEIDRRYRSRRPSPAPAAPAARSEDTDLTLPLTAVGVAVAGGLAGLLLWRHRRAAAVERAEGGLLLPRAVFATANRASEDQLRDQASHEVITFGELLDEVNVTGERANALMTRALDAYQAAGKVLDSATGVPDLAGVLVLVDQGRDALASARAVSGGGREVPPSPLCFFNPLHGDAAVDLDWRPVGTRNRLRIKTCRDCAKAARAKKTPQALLDDGVPYFETGSVWAETGYGHLRDDLIERVQRGDRKKS